MSFATQARHGFLVGLFARGAIEAVSIPTAMILARLLTPEDFGVFAAAGFIIVLAQRMTNFGFNAGLVRLTELTEYHTSSVFALNLAVGAAIWILLTVGAPAFGAFFRSPEAAAVVPLAAFSFVLGSLGSVPQALLTRDLRFKELLLRDSISAWATAISSVLFAWWGARYWALVYGQLIGACVSVLLRFQIVRWRPTTRISLGAIRELWSFASGIYAKRTLDAAAVNVDNLVIGRMLGIIPLGLYDKAFTTMNRAIAFASALGPAVSFSILAKLQDDPARFRAANRKVLLSTSLLAFPLFATLAAVAHPLFQVLFGPQWVASIPPFQLLCLAAPLKLLSQYVNAAMEAKGRVWGAAALQGVYLVLIVIGVAIGSGWGLVGASIGVLLPTLVVTVLTCDLLRRIANFSWADLLLPQVPGVLCGVVLGATLVGVEFLIGDRNGQGAILLLLVQSAVALVVYCAFLLLYPSPVVRELVRDTAIDFAPQWIRTRWLAARKPLAESPSSPAS